MANLQCDKEITALLVIDSGSHLVCGGAVQAAGGGLMARLGRGRRGLGALVGHGGQHELGDRRRRDHERSGAWSVRALCPRRRRIMSAVASSPTWRHVPRSSPRGARKMRAILTRQVHARAARDDTAATHDPRAVLHLTGGLKRLARGKSDFFFNVTATTEIYTRSLHDAHG